MHVCGGYNIVHVLDPMICPLASNYFLTRFVPPRTYYHYNTGTLGQHYHVYVLGLLLRLRAAISVRV